MTREDLIAELEAIAETARAGGAALGDGRAVNGRCALNRIRERADDAIRHARAAELEPAAAD